MRGAARASTPASPFWSGAPIPASTSTGTPAPPTPANCWMPSSHRCRGDCRSRSRRRPGRPATCSARPWRQHRRSAAVPRQHPPPRPARPTTGGRSPSWRSRPARSSRLPPNPVLLPATQAPTPPGVRAQCASRARSRRLDGYGWYDALDRVTVLTVQVAADGKWMAISDYPLPERPTLRAAALPARPAAIRIELAVRPPSGPPAIVPLRDGCSPISRFA